MDDYQEKATRKKWTTVLKEIVILLLAISVAGFLGWFIGRGDMGEMRVAASQLTESQEKLRAMRVERAQLKEALRVLKEGPVQKKETDLDRLLARKDDEWKKKLNEVRIAAEVEKVQRVEELEREIRMMKMDERMKAEMAEGDDTEVPDGLAEGLTPRARQVCAQMLEWEGLEEDELEAAKEKLRMELGARALVRVKFGSGSAFVGEDDTDALKVAVADTKDYALLLAVGFADTGGDEELNRELGSLRARNSANVLQGLIRRGQMVESVYLGETARFGPNKAENRVVEVWELQR